MYLPDYCDASLTFPLGNEKVNWINGNRERTIITVVTDSSLYFYLNNNQLLLCTLVRSKGEVNERGKFKKLYWRHNSKSVCVITSSNYVYIYTVEISQDAECFNLHDSYVLLYRQSPEFFLKQKRPIINTYLSVVAKIETEPQCVVSLKDELFICLKDGWIHRLSWNGDILKDLSFNIRNISFSTDQISAKSEKLLNSLIYVVDFIYCPLIGGLCAVLSDERACLLVSDSPQFNPQNIMAVWADGLNDAVCCTANHKFRLIYFGCKNGDITAYSLDDSNGSLIRVFCIKLCIKNGTEYLSLIDCVKQIQCLSQGGAFAVIWKTKTSNESEDILPLNNLSLEDDKKKTEDKFKPKQKDFYSKSVMSSCPPAVAIFSPFGAQWWSSFETTTLSTSLFPYTCIEWGCDGYQLWLGSTSNGISLINFVHSLPEFNDRVIMIGSDRVYLSPQRLHDELALAPHLIWETCKVPYDYIAANWPLKYVGMDRKCDRVLVAAGTRGFCFCILKNMKWRLFRKEAQEQDLCLTAEIVVYKEFVLVAVTNITNDSERLHAFNLSEQLDKDLATISLPINRILTMNSIHDYLLTFDFTSTITIYSLKQTVLNDNINKQEKFNLELECIAEIRIGELLPHPSCIVSIQLVQLNYRSDVAEFCPGLDSLLVNISGHLLLLSPVNQYNNNSTNSSESENSFQLHLPTLIASNVECVWIHSTHREIPYLNKALWINSGARKMQIWLPLSQNICSDVTSKTENRTNEDNSSERLRRSFISKRIMLPIELNIYPLAIDNDCLACGVECLILANSTFNNSNSSSHNLINDSNKNDKLNSNICARSLVRITEVFLHHLLKQLLKRNLGSYALAIASACHSLHYFSHVLELLLYDVLDEEATSSEPIPDPLLPTVASFINEFPEYLQTVVHCARKTELAFWNLLFSVTHYPRELYRMCMNNGDFDTAICCLILLQSMESITISTQFATNLLEEALTKRRWFVADDIIRFMQSIDSTELEQNFETPPFFQKLASRNNTKQKCSILPTDSASSDDLIFNNSASKTSNTNNLSTVPSNNIRPHAGSISLKRQSSSSSGINAANLTVSTNNLINLNSNHSPNNSVAFTRVSTSLNIGVPETSTGTKSTLTKMSSQDNGKFFNGNNNGTAFPDFKSNIENILERHGASLLEDYALRDFASFSSHLNINLKFFFGNSANFFNVPAENFPLVLMKLHAQFSWPYPVSVINNAFVASPSSNSLNLTVNSDGIDANSVSSLTFDTATAALTEMTADNEIKNEVSNSLKSEDSFSNESSNNLKVKTFDSSFSWKVFEKLYKNYKVKETEQSEIELNFLMNWFSETDALEWLFLLCILKQDVKKFKQKLQNELNNQKRLALFLKNVRDGTFSLYAWAEAKCPAYKPIIRVFKEFLSSS